jgi:uncharacterized LabA/DUF88 family protein
LQFLQARGFSSLSVHSALLSPDVHQRAILFVDGSNWYHSLRRNSVPAPFELDYAKVSQKLLGPREWVETRYYIGAVPESWNAQAHADQHRFLDQLGKTDPRITIHLGRLEPRSEPNPLASILRDYVKTTSHALPEDGRSHLRKLARQHATVMTLKEKAVDIMLAVDLIRLGSENRYDAAYILSADGDFTPAVEAVRATGRTVYAASPDMGYALRNVVKTFIRLERPWFLDCYRTK